MGHWNINCIAQFGPQTATRYPYIGGAEGVMMKFSAVVDSAWLRHRSSSASGPLASVTAEASQKINVTDENPAR